MEIQKVSQSKLGNFNFVNIGFGTQFTDHMVVADYSESKWSAPKIIPYGPFSMEPSSSVFHYGQALFEGMKAYKDVSGKVYLFRPDQNIKRFNRSC